jgi:hypothetical protein
VLLPYDGECLAEHGQIASVLVEARLVPWQIVESNPIPDRREVVLEIHEGQNISPEGLFHWTANHHVVVVFNGGIAECARIGRTLQWLMSMAV